MLKPHCHVGFRARSLQRLGCALPIGTTAAALTIEQALGMATPTHGGWTNSGIDGGATFVDVHTNSIRTRATRLRGQINLIASDRMTRAIAPFTKTRYTSI
jgi:hypothetical protein